MKKGLFITIEGIEGAGKSTAVSVLENAFIEKQRDYLLTREPGGTEIAEAIRHLLLSHYDEKMSDETELLLMFAARAQHLNAKILPALLEGKIVLCDRFTDASYAYQGAARGLNMDSIGMLEAWVQKGLQPDMTILLDLPVDVGLARAKGRGEVDRIEKEAHDFFEKVRTCYLERAKQYPERYRIVDASLPLEDVKAQLKALILREL